MTFKKGDKVRRKNGEQFSNGNSIVTIMKIENEEERIWFEETGTWLSRYKIEKVREIQATIK